MILYGENERLHKIKKETCLHTSLYQNIELSQPTHMIW